MQLNENASASGGLHPQTPCCMGSATGSRWGLPFPRPSDKSLSTLLPNLCGLATPPQLNLG